MWHLYLFCILSGLFAASGLPHLVKGLTGEKHETPFGKQSSAITNVLWGWLNLVVAGGFLYWADIHSETLRAGIFVAIGALLMSLLLAYTWSGKGHDK